MPLEPRLIHLALVACLAVAGCGRPPASTRAAPKPSPLELPPQTPLQRFELGSDGVVVCELPDGTTVYNVFEVAMQALEGTDRAPAVEGGLLPRLASTSPLGRPGQAEALAWLEANAEPRPGGAVVWLYRFDNAYNDVVVRAPWPSAFGQAYALWAMLRAYGATGLERHRALAAAAIRAFDLPVQEGGLKAVLPDGHVFFEEVPTERPPHILNGHLVSILALLDAAQALGDDHAARLAREGLATVEHHLVDYDLGDWTRYDLNPRKGELFFRVLPEPGGALVDVDTITLRLADQPHEQVVLDVGAPDDDRGAWRVFGGGWGPRQRRDGRTIRAVRDGEKALVALQMPRLVFDDWASVPRHELVMTYAPRGAGALSAWIRDNKTGDRVRFVPLARAGSLASGQWRLDVVTVEARRLTWYMGREYQVFHVALLEALAERTGRAPLAAAAARWRSYLR